MRPVRFVCPLCNFSTAFRFGFIVFNRRLAIVHCYSMAVSGTLSDTDIHTSTEQLNMNLWPRILEQRQRIPNSGAAMNLKRNFPNNLYLICKIIQNHGRACEQTFFLI